MRLTRITLLCLALIIGLGFWQLIIYLLDDIDAQTFQATEEVMVDTSHIVAGIVESELDTSALSTQLISDVFDNAENRQFRAKIYNHTKTGLGAHVYLTNKQGIVLYDSLTTDRVGQDYSRYNDVKLTLAGKYGARSSRTDENDSSSSILHVAAPIIHNDEIIGSVTIYKAQADTVQFVNARRNEILYATLLIGAGIILLTGSVFIWLFRPVGKLTIYAQSISRGERQAMPKLGNGREVNTLGKALHQMKETLEGRQYVENYVSSLTHELKSPIAAIKASAELLDEEMSQEQRQKFIDSIKRETIRSENLVQDLLQLVELERKPYLDNKRKFSISQLCHEIKSEITPRLENKNLSIDLSKIEPAEIYGDELIIKLALINIIENAIQYSPESGQISVTTKAVDNFVTIEVVDQGPGIPEYALTRVFEHFYSLPKPDSPFRGTGLGLPLVQEAAKLHKGSASIKNINQGGCQCSLTISIIK